MRLELCAAHDVLEACDQHMSSSLPSKVFVLTKNKQHFFLSLGV